jgi:hypothetical protein
MRVFVGDADSYVGRAIVRRLAAEKSVEVVAARWSAASPAVPGLAHVVEVSGRDSLAALQLPRLHGDASLTACGGVRACRFRLAATVWCRWRCQPRSSCWILSVRRQTCLRCWRVR